MIVDRAPVRRGKRSWWLWGGIALVVAGFLTFWPRAHGFVRYIVPAGFQGYLAIHVENAYEAELPTVDGVTEVRWDASGLLRVRSAAPLHSWHGSEAIDTQGSVVSSFVEGPSVTSSRMSGVVHWYYVGASLEDATWFLWEADGRQRGWLREHGVNMQDSGR